MKPLLLAVLLLVFAVAMWRLSRSWYPTESITTPDGLRMEIFRMPADCTPARCVAQFGLVTDAADSLEMRQAAQAFLPWAQAQATRAHLIGAYVQAVRPGLLRLRPPRQIRWYAMGLKDSDDFQWVILGEAARDLP